MPSSTFRRPVSRIVGKTARVRRRESLSKLAGRWGDTGDFQQSAIQVPSRCRLVRVGNKSSARLGSFTTLSIIHARISSCLCAGHAETTGERKRPQTRHVPWLGQCENSRFVPKRSLHLLIKSWSAPPSARQSCGIAGATPHDSRDTEHFSKDAQMNIVARDDEVPRQRACACRAATLPPFFPSWAITTTRHPKAQDPSRQGIALRFERRPSDSAVCSEPPRTRRESRSAGATIVRIPPVSANVASRGRIAVLSGRGFARTARATSSHTEQDTRPRRRRCDRPHFAAAASGPIRTPAPAL